MDGDTTRRRTSAARDGPVILCSKIVQVAWRCRHPQGGGDPIDSSSTRPHHSLCARRHGLGPGRQPRSVFWSPNLFANFDPAFGGCAFVQPS